MTIKRLNKAAIALLAGMLLIGSSRVAAQQFAWKAAVKGITDSGFARITLTPDILAHSHQLEDIRLMNGQQEVPYLIRQSAETYNPARFQPFPIIENKAVAGGISTLIFRNAGQKTLDHFFLVMKNAWVKKTVKISGSNDQQQWFGVTEPFVLDPAADMVSSSSSTILVKIGIPATDYTFYRLQLNDSASAPLNIGNIGPMAGAEVTTAQLAPLPDPVVITDSSSTARRSVFKIAFRESYLIKKLSLEISAPALFHRKARLASFTDHRQVLNNLADIDLISSKPSEIILPQAAQFDTLFLMVQNDDNPLLEIKTVKAWQPDYYLIAAVQPSGNYTLFFGDPQLKTPVYDLSYFKDSLPTALPTLRTDTLIALPKAAKAAAPSTFFSSPKWIWSGIILIIIVIGAVAVSMLRDMQKK
ncbi:DUF3999 domain-containing protein [Chitinophaga vietnamensis]|uniref:DUF3999 domain-containing protein n=1 Tax=Chitinophaga vietnamensis TaxID=2593957 RepID=UPI001177A76D|nr:DUF3999 domain-containing protein [Chitinophaga vietnamensis]